MKAAAWPARWRPRSLALAILVTVGLVMLGGWGLSPAWFAPTSIKLTRLFESTIVALTILVAVAGADILTDRGAAPLRTYLLAVIAGSVAGACLAWELRVALGFTLFMPPGEVLWTHWELARRLDLAVIGMLIGGLATYAHVNRRTALAARHRQHAAEQARGRAQRRTLESELQALQARIEPQFLFATLKQIRDLYRRDAGRAAGMLEHLIVYLRAALPHMRESSSTVEQETTLASSWLDIVGAGESGWSVEISVAKTAWPMRLPALVLLPLVHQVVACARAGTGGVPFQLSVSFSLEGGSLRLDLATSTDAFAEGIAGRPLLEEIDERLTTLYGNEVRLETRRETPGSALTLVLPADPSRDGRDSVG